MPVCADPLLDIILGVNCPLGEKDRAESRGEGTCADD